MAQTGPKTPLPPVVGKGRYSRAQSQRSSSQVTHVLAGKIAATRVPPRPSSLTDRVLNLLSKRKARGRTEVKWLIQLFI